MTWLSPNLKLSDKLLAKWHLFSKKNTQKTGISLCTVENNLHKLKECKSIERKEG